MPEDVRYVITLDADTRLPRDTVRRLIGKMAHPLNQPRFDADAGGWSKATRSCSRASRRRCRSAARARCFSASSRARAASIPMPPPCPTCTRTCSAKAPTPARASTTSMPSRPRWPAACRKSTLLSHDLFEGMFARAGLASDVEVVEEFPARYDVAATRHHRWARGDWQLLPWIFGRGPIAGSRSESQRDSGDRPLEDARQSAADAVGAGGHSSPCWPAGPCRFDAAAVWTVLRPRDDRAADLDSRRRRRSSRGGPASRCAATSARSAPISGCALAQSALMITFLAHQAWLMADAIARTLVRLFVTRRHLLEWVTAAQATIGPRLDFCGFYRRMAGGGRHRALWRCSSAGRGAGDLAARAAVRGALDRVAGDRALDQPIASVAGRLSMSDGDARALRLIARRTWRFFETFVTPADNMLPPDNFQEDPAPVLAHRTSPTNIGLYLLSAVSARDFGWIGNVEAVERLEATLATHEPARALSRPFLQLVRHAGSAAARSALRLVGRQRQSGRASDRARQCVPGVGGTVRSRTRDVLPVSQTRSSSRAKRRAICATAGERRR